MEKILCFFVLAICGATAIYHQADNRLTGGLLSRENEFPFAVSLQEISQLPATITRGHKCGGVLITPSYVLTAASCTFKDGTSGTLEPIVPNEHRVFAGSVLLTNDTSPDRFRIVVNVTRHPEYTSGPAYANDIAILGLNNPFDRAVATPLTIPSSSFQPAEGSLCVVVGWGSQNLTSTASISQRYARKYIAIHNVCTLQYALMQGPNVLPSMICAQSYDIISTGCTGDQGNGLICNGGLAGILSLTNNCLPTAMPEVYTRVANYSTWIRSVTGGASTFQPGVTVLIMLAVVQLITAKVMS